MTNIAKDYNSAIAAVDIAIFDVDKRRLLLGRKKNATLWRFCGGFVDEKDESYEMAARREASEEAPNIEISYIRYVGSARIDDPRYKDDKDKIFAALFAANYVYGPEQGGDDIELVKFFDISEFIYYKDFVVPEHWIWIETLKKNLYL